jgi:rhodanese-related sulfurtransferase
MISPAELELLMKSDTPHAVLDLRERGAYQKRHIFRATSLPRRLLEQRLPLLVPALPTPIVLCDDTSALSALAVPTFRAMGYSNVLPLAGGLDAWVAEGRPTAQGVREGCQGQGDDR